MAKKSKKLQSEMENDELVQDLDEYSEDSDIKNSDDELEEGELQNQEEEIDTNKNISKKKKKLEDQKNEKKLKKKYENLSPEKLKEMYEILKFEKLKKSYLEEMEKPEDQRNFDNIPEKELKQIQQYMKQQKLNELKEKEIDVKSKKDTFWDSVCILSILALLLFGMTYMKYIEGNYNKTVKISSGGYSDLYEVLELDSSASMIDIKRQYKKLAKLWHPDLNKDCKNCDEKFQLIAQAYEVLGKDESRDSYDQTRGVSEAITSRAIQLNKRNFENFVLESNDVWIIQIYENSNKLCKQMAPFFESAVDRYQGVVKFGRINRETDMELLRYLPTKVQILPTTISFVNRGEHSDLYIFERRNPEGSMFKFVTDAIPMNVNIFGRNDAKQLFKSLKSTGFNDKSVDIVYLAQQGKMPIEFKYASHKFGDDINFHVSKYADYTQTQFFFGKTSDNFFIFYKDLATQERKQISLRMTKKFDPSLFNKFLKLARFVSVPELDKATFKDSCENFQVRSGNEQYDEDDSDQQNLCIVINSQEKSVLTDVNRIREETVQEISKNLKSLNNQNEKVFENFGQIMFITLDLEHNWQFEKSMTQNPDQPFPFKSAFLYAILAESRKISYPKSVIGIEDWLYDLFDNDGNNLEYLNDYLPQELLNIEIAHLLKFKGDNPQTLFLKSLGEYAQDWRVWVSCLAIWIGGAKFARGSGRLFLGCLLVVCVGGSFIDNYEEFFH